MQVPGLPRLGPGTKGLLFVLIALGLVTAIATNLAKVPIFDWLVCAPDAVFRGQLWRPLTSTFLTSPVQLSHLLFSVVAVFFLAPDLERRWGTFRLVRFFIVSSLVSYALALGVAWIFRESENAILSPRTLMGPEASIAALAVAWGAANASSTIRLFFVIPVSGRAFAWISLASAILAFIYPYSPVGPIALLTGTLYGMILGAPRGEPSFLRRLYLEWRLRGMQKKKGMSALEQLKLSNRPPPLKTKGGPVLRVVRGESKPPPKDKRYLN